MNNRRTFIKCSIGSSLAMALGSRIGAEESPIAIFSQKPKAMIVATTGPSAIRNGLETMKLGGTAADAVLTTALSQIALCAGCWVSYAGRMTAVYFDAKTKRVHALNACYDAPRKEDDPLSIPRQPTPSGRNVLVPGFMAGVESFHSKFGKRKFTELFAPAIKMADEGMPLSQSMANLIRRKEKVITRFAEGRQVFLNENEKLYSQGEHFRQSKLATTLKQVAKNGAQYMYRGDWAKRFVELVQEQGGRISLEDLKQYRPTWSEPLTTQMSDGLSVSGLPSPNRGGPMALACLNLADHAKLGELGHYTESLESLERILKIETAFRVVSWDRGRATLGEVLGKDNLELDDFADRDLGGKLWKTIQSKDWKKLLDRLRAPQQKSSEHSDSVVAVDPDGNVGAILHTINTGGWGTTGLFVDGVSIPDSGANQQAAIKKAGPGGRVSDHGPPLIAMKNGKPVLAGSATGSGNVYASWQNFIDVLLYKMSAQKAADTANFYNYTFEESTLGDELIKKAKAAGLPLRLKPRFGGNELGFWTGISFDAKNNSMQAGKIRKLDGISVHF